MGEPDALKGASPVRRGAVGKGLAEKLLEEGISFKQVEALKQYLAGRLLYVRRFGAR